MVQVPHCNLPRCSSVKVRCAPELLCAVLVRVHSVAGDSPTHSGHRRSCGNRALTLFPNVCPNVCCCCIMCTCVVPHGRSACYHKVRAWHARRARSDVICNPNCICYATHMDHLLVRSLGLATERVCCRCIATFSTRLIQLLTRRPQPVVRTWLPPLRLPASRCSQPSTASYVTGPALLPL